MNHRNPAGTRLDRKREFWTLGQYPYLVKNLPKKCKIYFQKSFLGGKKTTTEDIFAQSVGAVKYTDCTSAER